MDERKTHLTTDSDPLPGWRSPAGPLGRARVRLGARAAQEEGITLIEVMISALMVGFIALATFNGFDAANHATTAERLQNQATLLAAQSQEALRSDSATTLDRIEESSHVYKQTVGGETYTIVQSDKWVADNNQNASCSASGEEHSAQAGNYLQIHTMVTWPQQLAANGHALEQYSIITPPDGSGLEVDVLNGLTPKQPVPGVTVVAGEGPTASTATTGEAGCVIFGGIPATRINVEAFKLGDVTQAGAIKKVFPEVLVAPNITTHVPVTLNQGAAITAEFAYKGEKTYEGKPVTGDTFVAYNTGLESAPHLELGSTSFNATYGSEGQYEALTGKYEATTATTPKSGTYYPSGNLFPYEKAWDVYAGDCEANNPSTVTKGEVAEATVILAPGQDATVKVPTSLVMLNVYKSAKGKTEPETTSRPVKITNEACKSSKTPNNASAFSYAHTQNTTTVGHLEAPFQPFGESFILCLYNPATGYKFSTTYSNKTVAGTTINLFLKETKSYTDENNNSIKSRKTRGQHMLSGRPNSTTAPVAALPVRGRRLALADEHGFTMIELMVSMVTGLVVCFALYAIFMVATNQSSRLTDYAQSTQQGRSRDDQDPRRTALDVPDPGLRPDPERQRRKRTAFHQRIQRRSRDRENADRRTPDRVEQSSRNLDRLHLPGRQRKNVANL